MFTFSIGSFFVERRLRVRLVLYNFKGEGFVKLLYNVIWGWRVSKIDTFLLYNMWTAPSDIEKRRDGDKIR